MNNSVNNLKHQIKIQEDVIEAQSKIITEIQQKLNSKNQVFQNIIDEKKELELQLQNKSDLMDQYQEQIAMQEKQLKSIENELIKTKLHNAQLQTEINEKQQDINQYQKFMTKMNSVETSSAGSMTPYQQSPTGSMKNINIFINDNLINDLQQNENKVFKKIDFADESMRQSYQKAVQDNKEVFRNSTQAFSDNQEENKSQQDTKESQTQIFYDNISFQKNNNNNGIDELNQNQLNTKQNTENNQFQQKEIDNDEILNNRCSLGKSKKESQDEVKISSIIKVIKMNPLLVGDTNNTPQDEKISDEQLKIWKKEIMPLFAQTYPDKINKQEKIYPKMKSLIKKFIPMSLRPKIWSFLIGNKLKITKNLYTHILENYQKNSIPQKVKNLIKEDLNRTYPTIKEFNKGGDIYNNLMQILELWQYYRPDVGYIQGMAYPCAILLMIYKDSYKVFKNFSNLIVGNEFILNLFSFKVEYITIYSKTFESLLKERHPNVYKHLKFHKIQSEVYLIEWFYTLFCRAFSFSIVAKCWDLFLYYGEVAFFKIAVSVFTMIEDKIIELDFDGTLFLIRNSTKSIDQVMMLKTVIDQKLKKEKFEEKLKKEKQLYFNQQKSDKNNSNNNSLNNSSRKYSQASQNSQNSNKKNNNNQFQ